MTATATINDAKRRHDFLFLFEVHDGNPNGDPDAGNLPRIDPETNQGLVTDVCLKRKVRNWIDATRADQPGMGIYIQNKQALNSLHEEAYAELGKKGQKKADAQTIDEARMAMCRRFYDVRTFGAVMTTGVNCGQVRGPVQLTFARSLDPIVAHDVSITRIAVTKKEDLVAVDAEEDEKGNVKGKTSEMGRKALVPYGLYVGYGFINGHFARQTGFDDTDLAAFWESMQLMWDLDHSAARGRMACRGLYVFSHDSALGSAPSQMLFERVKVALKPEVEVPRTFEHYEVKIDEGGLPGGVQLTRLVG